MKRARISLATSMVIFGTIGLFKRFIPVTSGELALYRAILAAVLLGGVLLCTRQRIPWKAIGRQIPLLLDAFKNTESVLALPGIVLKINRRELAALTGCGDTAEALRRLFGRFPLRAAAITDGPGNAYCCDGRTLFCYTIPQLDKVVNPIGCGDTASAVLLSELLDDTPPVEAFKLALGAAGANAATLLPADFDISPAYKLAGAITVEQLKFDRSRKL